MDINYEMIFAIASILDIYSLHKLLEVFLGNEIKNRKQLYLMSILYYLISTFAHFIVDIPIVLTSINILGFYCLSTNYRSIIQKRILSSVFIFAILSGVEILVVLISGYQSLSLFEQGEFASVTGIVIIKLLTYVLALGLDKFRSIRMGKAVPVSYWFCLFFVPSSSIFILFQSLTFEMLTYNMLTIEVILFLIINLSVFYLYDRLTAKMLESAERQLQIQEQEGYLKQYELMRTSMESIKGLKHDLRNHFMTLHALATDGNAQELIKYIEEMESLTELHKNYIDTKNVILDSILNYKIFESEKKGITIVPDVIFPSDVRLDTYDLTVVLGNLLDNAMEASANRRVNITVRYTKGCMTIKVINDFSGKLNYDLDGHLKTGKMESQHGLGLKNVERITGKYNGMLDVQAVNQNFEAFVLLYIE